MSKPVPAVFRDEDFDAFRSAYQALGGKQSEDAFSESLSYFIHITRSAFILGDDTEFGDRVESLSVFAGWLSENRKIELKEATKEAVRIFKAVDSVHAYA